MKFLLLLLVFVVVYWTIKGLRKNRRDSDTRQRTAGVEDMVRCERCGVHLPRSESLISGDAFYCSAEHERSREKVG